MDIIDSLNWRYATKKFDETKRVSNEDIEVLKEAIRLSPTSYGLDLYKVFVIEDKELLKKLQPVCWNQPHITQASHMFVFANVVKDFEPEIEKAIERKAKLTGKTVEEFNAYKNFVLGKMALRTQEGNADWTAKQTYIGLSNLMTTAAHLRIDSCPLEGFEPNQVNEVLGLEEKGLNAAVLALVGYRAEDDKAQHNPKSRKTKEELFETI